MMKGILKRSPSFDEQFASKFANISNNHHPIKMNSIKPLGVVKKKIIRFNDSVYVGEATTDYDRRPSQEPTELDEENKADVRKVLKAYKEDQEMTRLLMRFNQKMNHLC
uniref:Uncharacterized protein n=1 Tax=Globodera rostochiensis TaxID=31243 RepID=A0A914IFX8_GLORO